MYKESPNVDPELDVEVDFDHLPVTDSTKALLRRLDNWKSLKDKLYNEYYKIQVGAISHSRYSFEKMIDPSLHEKFDMIFSELCMITDTVRVKMYTELVTASNKNKLLEKLPYNVIYLTNSLHVERSLDANICEDGFQVITIAIGSYYDIALILGTKISLIQIQYLALVDASDTFRATVSECPTDIYVLDGAEHIIENVYQLTPEACLYIPHFEQPKDGLSIQMSFRVLKKR